MTRTWILSTVLLSLAGGCAQSLYPGPSFLNSRNPDADRRRYERFDPLPAGDIAPDTFARPRGYENPRSLPRRADESRRLLGVPTDVRPTLPSARNDYPGVVEG